MNTVRSKHTRVDESHDGIIADMTDNCGLIVKNWSSMVYNDVDDITQGKVLEIQSSS